MIEGEYFRKRRQERGMSLAQLSELCGLDKHHLSRIENDKMEPSIKSVNKILNAMGLKLHIVPIDTTEIDKSEAWRQLLDEL